MLIRSPIFNHLSTIPRLDAFAGALEANPPSEIPLDTTEIQAEHKVNLESLQDNKNNFKDKKDNTDAPIVKEKPVVTNDEVEFHGYDLILVQCNLHFE